MRAAPYSRRNAVRRHGVPLMIAAVAAFAAGTVVGAIHRPAHQRVAERFVRAWQRGDYAAMYGLLSAAVRDRTSLGAFRDAYAADAATATATRLRFGRPREAEDHRVVVAVRVATRVFGSFRTTLELSFADDGGEPRVAWQRHHAFPGVGEGERLTRETTLPTRATLLAADGSILASGAERRTDLPDVAGSIVGQLGDPAPDDAQRLRAAGVPPGAKVGVSGLERALDDALRGRPGGRLFAGSRTLASSVASPAGPVRSTIVPRVQRAAVAALAGRVGGVVALDPRTGRVQAAAGIGFSGLQPPGSTFKIVTLTGALQAGITSPSKRYPVETKTSIEGVELENANGESCGGTLIASFAESCNSVFAPLGARLGARRLVATAEAFGFNQPPGIAGAATSTIPRAEEIGDDLAVGASAIGQGRVQATALQMAVVAATIAERGRRPRPTVLAGTPPDLRRVVDAATARTVGRAMRAVVRYGTGTAAAFPDTPVAGKTGTAELRSSVGPQPETDPVTGAPIPRENDPTDTDAWFAAYAPAGEPRVAVGLLLVEAGAGGAVAAPAAKGLLEAALRRRG